jgi:hypothetical protein
MATKAELERQHNELLEHFRAMGEIGPNGTLSDLVGTATKEPEERSFVVGPKNSSKVFLRASVMTEQGEIGIYNGFFHPPQKHGQAKQPPQPMTYITTPGRKIADFPWSFGASKGLPLILIAGITSGPLYDAVHWCVDQKK